MYEMPLNFVFGGWGFGVGESIFSIGVLDVGIASLAFRPEINENLYIRKFKSINSMAKPKLAFVHLILTEQLFP